MMTLRLMNRVVETVDREWRSPLAFQIMENWGYDEEEVYYWRASANFIFKCVRDGKTTYLRFNDVNERTYKEIESELKIVQYLEEQSIPVAQPVLSKNCRFIETVETDWGTFHAVLFEAAEGQHLEFDDLDEEQFFLWGSTLGRLHEALKKAPNVLRKGRPSWREHLAFVEGVLPQEDLAVREELKSVTQWAESLEKTDENYGIIHYDFELDNLKLKEHRMEVLDFDDCAVSWYIADVVNALRDAGRFDVHSPNIQKFLEGYRQHSILDEDQLREAEEFNRMHRLVTYAKLIRAVDLEESAEQPEWLAHLREKLIRKIEEYRQSLKVLS